MTYKDARDYIDASARYGNELSLTAITELLRRLDNPQDKLKVIHVAGTNGKGSTTAFLASILAAQGYKVGRYISPAVFNYLERVQITNKSDAGITTALMSEDGVSAAIEMIKPICDQMLLEGQKHPTTFEIETVMAILYLYQEQVDFAIIEVGLGGRLDATNVFTKPLCCVITSISLDHMEFLGDTLDKIAKEKAGIIKKGTSVITGNTRKEVLNVLEETCKEKEAELVLASPLETDKVNYLSDRTTFVYLQEEYTIHMLGEYQVSNAVLAIQTVLHLCNLGIPIRQEAIKTGLLGAHWSGRFELLRKEPLFIIDGAHNADAALQLKNTIERYFKDKRLIYILGVLADKDYHSILSLTASLADIIYTITPKNIRGLASAQLAIEAKKYCKGLVFDADNVENAVKLAYENAEREDVILAFGSLSYLGEVKEQLLRRE
ncbi:MAG: folylpolyglutamate synthase/dihydrofolate synthase family protein [Mobilitalea sp.]